jgi:tetratricopeptide (TPR) repeat protein
MRCFKYLVFVFNILILITGCSKNQMSLIDDTEFIVDDSAILMLYKIIGQEANKELMVQLKGNGNSLIEAIKILEDIKQDASIKNALGVSYLRLRRFHEANSEFQEALRIAVSDEEKMCILSNMAEVMLYQENRDTAKNYVEEALKLEVDDQVKKLVLQSNLTAIELPFKTDFIQEIGNIKELIKKERKILGSNQFIGIFNYKTLSWACYYAGNMKKCEYYIDKASKLNDKLYQYIPVEANLYKTLSFMYEPDYNLNKAYDYVNKAIDLLEIWQVQDHYDLLNLYELRGNIYMNLGWANLDLAIKDYEHVLEKCLPYHDLAAVSYYNLGNAYWYYGGTDKIIESYARAYYIWNLEGYEDFNQKIEEVLRSIYEKQADKDDDYESWFQTQIIQGKEDLSKLWKE